MHSLLQRRSQNLQLKSQRYLNFFFIFLSLALSLFLSSSSFYTTFYNDFTTHIVNVLQTEIVPYDNVVVERRNVKLYIRDDAKLQNETTYTIASASKSQLIAHFFSFNLSLSFFFFSTSIVGRQCES